MPFCEVCNLTISKRQWVGHLRSNSHKNNDIPTFIDENVQLLNTAFRGRIVSYKILAPESENSEEVYSIKSFLHRVREKVKFLIDKSLKIHTNVKVNFELFSMFFMFKNDSTDMKSFGTKNFSIHKNYKFDKIFSKVENILTKKMEEFQERDSGWTFLHNSHLEININKYQPLNGSKFITLPKCIQNKKACLNIRNNDEYCFLWSVTAALYPSKQHPERVTSYPHYQNVFNIKDMTFPVSFNDIAIFEKNNPHVSICVYGLKKNKFIVGPLYKSESDPRNTKRVHLLLLENDNSSHYCLIKDLPRLVRSQITKHHGKLFFCESCLLFFPSENELNSHVCGGVVTLLPEKGSVLQFKNYERKQNIPYVIYADFETMLQPVQGCEPDPNSSGTYDLQQHIPVAFAYSIICTHDETQNSFINYRGGDCVSKFISCITRDAKEIHSILTHNKPMDFTQEDANSFENAKRCHICNHLLWHDKVRDHCHMTGRYRGAAHRHCNLQFKSPKFIPIFFHNLSGYDCHLFIKELGELPGKIKIIPKTKENYISFSKYLPLSNEEYVQLRFTDSFKFLGTSLENLAKTMSKDDFVNLRSWFPNDDEFNLLTRKGVYPYDYMTSWQSYSENKLPSKTKFYNTLTNENISDDDYKHAKLVWSQFNIKDMGEYTDLYLKTDVLLLTDIFQNFRKTCKRYYDLDPAYYLTAPSLSFDAMLLKTGVQLELLNDLSIIRMIQRGIRGGLCACSHRFVKANHKYMINHDPSEESVFVQYFDSNNLYGFSMCQSLPYSKFRYLDEQEIEQLNVSHVPDDAENGYILEVDLLYPKHLHREHNDFPFCPEKCIPPGGKNKKLVANVYNKYNYVIHYVHLKKCLEHGLILRKIHKAITFRQSAYLKKYIDLNTQLRQESTTTFEQDFFKLLNNSVFGKTLENNESRVNIHLVNQWTDSNNKTKKRTTADRLIASPHFHSASIFTENLVAVQLKQEEIVLDKPIYIGFSVLELSKTHMYNFHYNIIKPFYQNRVKLCYTDTDSFVYSIKTNDFYQDLKNKLLCYFDTSNYNPNEFDLPLINKKVPGYFKDEMGGKIITEFVGLRSKLYCIKTENKVIKKAKGIKSYVVRDLNIADYENVLHNKNIIRKKNILFRSIKHEIFTRSVNKIVLSSNDDKRYITSDNISTIAWGSELII